MDITQIAGLIAKGGPAAIVYAVLFGLAMLVREVRSGKVSNQKEADLVDRLTKLEGEMAGLKKRFDRLTEAFYSMRYQRDQARVRVEFLEQLHGVDPRTQWQPDPYLTSIEEPDDHA